MSIEREEFDALLDQLEQRMIAREQEVVRQIVEQQSNATTKTEVEGIVVTSRGRRVVMVIIVMVTLVSVDHIFPIAALMRGTELLFGVFFEYWFNAAKNGVFDPHIKKMFAFISYRKNKKVVNKEPAEKAINKES